MKLLDSPVLFLARREWKFAEKNRKNIVLYVSLFLIAHTFYFFEPLVIAKIFNIIQEMGLAKETVTTVIPWLVLLIGLTFGFWIFHGPARVIENKNAFMVRANYKKYLLDGTMNLPAEWHTNHHSGNTIDKIDKATDSLYRFSEETFIIIESITKLLGSYFALAYFNLHASYIVLLTIIITGALIIKFDKILVEQYHQLYKAENRISAKIFDIISNITTVIILRVQKLVSKAMFKKIIEPLGLFVKNNKINETKWFLVSLLSGLMIFSVILSFLYSSVKAGDAVLLGTIFILYEYVQRINNLFFRFAYKYGEIVMQKTAVLNGEEISREFVSRKKFKHFDLKGWKMIEVKNLVFSYNQKDENLHLDNISFNMHRGERIALIGSSGSGKTTALKLIRELYHPREVKVIVDGITLKSGFESISDEIALIPQDPEIFATTIRDNITLGIGKNLKEIKKYTDMAMFTDVVKRLPRGLNSSIVEKGVNLSGGEKQRLALARGLMASEDKSILLLDEPTSSVDSRNELKIYENIFSKFKNKTILSSIHRLHLLSLFDTILLFKNGQIAASGTFDEILKNSEEFKDMWSKYMKSRKKS
ncbi:MAG TPA: ABC transporter ATP-binding protein [Candidatus Nanoarchaeia archaeon]|nr:ABC transporter ATP-binding protein [Candidatus Nanoarchaeia archaeon]